MKQYISKSALIAEIERLNPPFYPTLAEKMSYQDATKDCIDIIYTLKVKEVDLEKEIKKVQRKYKTIEEYKGYPCTMYADNIEWIAKHFFELGMSVNNKV